MEEKVVQEDKNISTHAKVETLPTCSDIAIKEIVDKEVNVVLQQKMVHIKEQFSGPLPHPKHMEMYKKIDKTLPDRIVKMSENNLKHQQDIEKKVLNNEIITSLLGWLSSTAFSFSLLYVAYQLIMDGKSIESFVALVAGITPIGTMFYKNSKKKD